MIAMAADLGQRDDTDDTDDDPEKLQLGALLDDLHGEEGKIQESARTGDHQNDIIPGHAVDLLNTLLCGWQKYARFFQKNFMIFCIFTQKSSNAHQKYRLRSIEKKENAGDAPKVANPAFFDMYFSDQVPMRRSI